VGQLESGQMNTGEKIVISFSCIPFLGLPNAKKKDVTMVVEIEKHDILTLSSFTMRF